MGSVAEGTIKIAARGTSDNEGETGIGRFPVDAVKYFYYSHNPYYTSVCRIKQAGEKISNDYQVFSNFDGGFGKMGL